MSELIMKAMRKYTFKEGETCNYQSINKIHVKINIICQITKDQFAKVPSIKESVKV